MQALADKIKAFAKGLGFQQIGITDTDLSHYTPKLRAWLAEGRHGEMHYMEKHGDLRSQPSSLVKGAIRVISARMDYLPPETHIMQTLRNSAMGYISRYALGKDYHKLMRRRLQKLADEVTRLAGKSGYRVFSDSAPVLEKPLAEKAGLGWIGKHTNLINSKAGSWFFLGEILTDLPLPIDAPTSASHCGSCRACIDICPTQAITGPYQLDARRCISYLTIEHKGSIDVELRPLMGNRIYGCDDCQLCCPWNKFAKTTAEPAFHARHGLEQTSLIDLFAWTEEDFKKYTEGSAIRRIGYECWLRNIAIALGNASPSAANVHALNTRLNHTSALVREHCLWALQRQHHLLASANTC